MNARSSLLLAWLVGLVACGGESSNATQPAQDAGDPGTGPTAYFIAVHNEPAHVPGGETLVAENYQLLRDMVARADASGVKLTLMFSAQWADHIVADAGRHDEVRAWKAAGHEIAAHHHSICHGNWDGYTDYTAAEATEQRVAQGYQPEPYLGTLDDFAGRLAALDPDVVSGCMNDEVDKAALPRTILFDTCLGYANHGDVGVDESDALAPEKGVNDFASVGTWDGVKRTWLAHYQITQPERTAMAQEVFDAMRGGVYGAVLHSTESQAEELYKFVAFLEERDPGAARSRTVRDVVESGSLPERTVPDELLQKKPPPSPNPQGGPCGDGVCDDKEKANPTLCPEDC